MKKIQLRPKEASFLLTALATHAADYGTKPAKTLVKRLRIVEKS